MQFDIPAHRIVGPAGVLPVLPDDLVVSRLAMLAAALEVEELVERASALEIKAANA